MKNIAIIGGVTLIIATIGLFVYVLVVKKATDQAPQVTTTGEVTRGAGLISNSSSTDGQPSGSTSANLPPFTAGTSTLATSTTPTTPTGSALRTEKRFTQLSTDAVAGMTFLSTSTVRYITRGDGSITDVAFDGSILGSITTRYTGILSGLFSHDGSRLIATIHDAGVKRFLVGSIAKNARGQNELRGSLLPAGTTDAVFADDNGNVRYLLAGASGGEIHTYSPITRDDSFEALLPYTSAHMTVASTSTYLYTTPSYTQNGFVHRYAQKSLQYVLPGGMGLTAMAYSGGILSTMYRDGKLSTFVSTSAGTTKLPNIMKTDACTELPSHTSILCARPYSFPESQYPDSWYTGESTHNDLLFTIDTQTKSVSIVANPFEEAGQVFDINHIVAHPFLDNYALLINKNNQTLWLFTNDIKAQ